MNRKMASSFLLAVGAVALCAPAFAHHGTGVSYDQSKAYKVKAVVTEFRYANPHPQIFFDVKDDQGKVVHWSGEIAPNPAQLVQDGWGKKRSEMALAPGTEVTITLAPSRLGTPVGLIDQIEGPTGELILGLRANEQPGGPAGGRAGN